MLARILYLILRVLGWKKRTFCQNQGWTSPFFHHLPTPCYSRSLWRLSCDVFEFLLKRRLYLQAQKSCPDPRSQRLCIDPESLPVLEMMRQGGLFLAAHYGNYECSGWWLRRLGIPLVASYQPQKPAFLDAALRSLRSIEGQPYASLLKPREILKTIQEENLFCLLADQDYRGEKGIPSRFLGRPVRCNPLPVFLCKHLESMPVYVCFIENQGKNRILYAKQLEYESASQLYPAYHAWLEERIQADPDGWYGWFHRRFYSEHPLLYVSRETKQSS